MRFLFSTGSLYTYSISRCFGFASAAGFDGIELMVDHRWDSRQTDYIASLIHQYNLPVIAVHAPLRTVSGWPEGIPAHIEQTLRMAEVLGAAIVVHHLPMRVSFGEFRFKSHSFIVPLPWGPMHKDYVAWLDSGYTRLQETTDVQLCIENMPANGYFGRLWNPAHWNTIDTIQRFSSLTMDTTHLGTWGLNPTDVYKQLNGRVKHIHLSNYNGHEHRRPEDGELRLDRLLAHLATTGYKGAVTIELSPDALDAGCDDAHLMGLLSTSLELCRTWAAAGENREG
jgi:sugar phosphate isomerase/epimerase